MRRVRARIFNIMQYERHPETGEILLTQDTIEEACHKKSVVEYAYILHDKDPYSEADEEADPNHKKGTAKPRHWHIVLQCKNQVEISNVAKWFGIAENFVDVPKGRGAGKFTDCVEYLTHESEKQQELGKHRYEDTEVYANFDFRKRIEKRNENKIKYGKDLDPKQAMMFDVMYGGKTLRQCMAEDEILYMDNFEKLQKMRMQYIAHQKPPKTRINYYISGEGGMGKGLLSRALARSMYPQYDDDEDIFFEVGAKGSPFEGYDGQPVIIWNDRRAFELLQELNGRGNVFNVFDTHPTRQRQNIKFSSIRLCNEVNIVNSTDTYTQFLDGLAGEYVGKDGTEYKSEDKTQSYRRFPFIIPLHKEDFDLLMNKGFMEDTRDFEEYVEYRNIRGNMQRIQVLCGGNEELARELEAKTVKPVIDKFNDVREKYKDKPVDADAVRKELAEYGTMPNEG
jgi:hypothetical protein